MVSFTERDKHLYYHPPTAATIFNMQKIMGNAGKIGEKGNNQAFVLVLTWLIFAQVSIRVVVSFTDHRHLLVFSPTKGKVRSNLINYDNYELKHIRSECNKAGSLNILYPSIIMKIRSFKIQRRRKRGSHGSITRKSTLNNTSIATDQPT